MGQIETLLKMMHILEICVLEQSMIPVFVGFGLSQMSEYACSVHKILFNLISRSRVLLLLSAFAILGAQHHLAAGQLLSGKNPQGQQCLGDDGNQMKS